jgi:tetratricopeptide (TPR) repeat protein
VSLPNPVARHKLRVVDSAVPREVTPEFEDTVASYAAHYVTLLQRHGPALRGGGKADDGAAQCAAVLALQGDLENLYAVLRLGLERGEPAWLLALARHLLPYLSLSGEFRALYEQSQLLLAGGRRLHSLELEAEAQLGLSRSLTFLGRVDEARQAVAKARALADQLSLPTATSGCLHAAGSIEYGQGHYAAAGELMQQALAHARATGNRHSEAEALVNFGSVCFMQGQHAEALAYYDEAYRIQQEVGDRAGEAGTLTNLGNAELVLGNLDAARELYQRALKYRRELGGRQGIARSLVKLGLVAFTETDYAGAIGYYEEALAMEEELGDVAGRAFASHNLGNVAFMQEQYETAARWYLRALRLRSEVGARRSLLITIACSSAALAALGQWQPAVYGLYGAQAMQQQLGYAVDGDDVPILRVGEAQIGRAVAAGTISTEQVEQWTAAGAGLEVEKLGQLTQSSLTYDMGDS